MERWDLAPLSHDFETAVEKLQGAVNTFTQEDLSPDSIEELLEQRETIAAQLREISAYYQLRFSEDTADQDILAKRSRLKQIQTELQNQLLFFKHWFQQLPDAAAQECKERAPDHAYYLKRIRDDTPYTQDEAIEEVLNIKATTSGDAFSNFYQVVTNQYQYTFEGDTVTRQELLRHVRSPDRERRQAAYETLLDKHAKESTALTEVYKNVALDWSNEGVEIRGHDSPIAVRHHANDVSGDAVDALLATVRDNIHLFTDYFEKKAAFLGHEHSRYHIYAPYTVDREYTYEESKQFVLDAFKEFDTRFHDAAKRIFKEEHVHSHPEQGKRGGAFNMSVHNDCTPYVMLNHTGELRDVFTMAHELGHAVHGVLSQDQPNLVYNASLPMAETASVFAETIVAKKLMDTGDDEERLATMYYLLDKLYGSIARQAYFTVFERRAHDAVPEGVTKEELDRLWLDTVEEQFGDMSIPETFRHEWHAVPHFHHSPFYCYAYSWGNLSVLSMFKRYEREGDAFVEDYVDVLRQGGSASPADLLGYLGLSPEDEEFWQQGFDVVEDMLDELRGLMHTAHAGD